MINGKKINNYASVWIALILMAGMINGCGKTTETITRESEDRQTEQVRKIDRDTHTDEKITADIPFSLFLQMQGIELPTPQTGAATGPNDPATDRGPALDGLYSKDSLIRVTIDRQTNTVERETEQTSEAVQRNTQTEDRTERKGLFSGFRLGIIVALLAVVGLWLLSRRFSLLSLFK